MPLSSRKTSRSGEIVRNHSRNASRRLRFSSVSRSMAWRDFFRRKSNSPTIFQRWGLLTETPVDAFSSTCNSRRYKSGLFFSNATTAVRSTRLFGPGRYGLRSIIPVRFFALEIFHAQARLTPNWSASSESVPLPSSCASSSFLRRSSLYGRAILTTFHQRESLGKNLPIYHQLIRSRNGKSHLRNVR